MGQFENFSLAIDLRLVGESFSALAHPPFAPLTQCHRCRILAFVRVRQWRAIHMLADCLLYDTKSIDGEISIFALA